MTPAGGSIIFNASSDAPASPAQEEREARGWNGEAPARVARQRHCACDGGRDHRRGLRAHPIARGPPRLGHLSPSGAARRLASRAHSGAGRGGWPRALVGIFFLFALLQLLSLAAQRDPQPAVVHGGGGGDEPPCELHEAANRARQEAREGNGQSLRLLAPAGGGPIRREKA